MVCYRGVTARLGRGYGWNAGVGRRWCVACGGWRGGPGTGRCHWHVASVAGMAVAEECITNAVSSASGASPAAREKTYSPTMITKEELYGMLKFDARVVPGSVGVRAQSKQFPEMLPGARSHFSDFDAAVGVSPPEPSFWLPGEKRHASLSPAFSTAHEYGELCGERSAIEIWRSLSGSEYAPESGHTATVFSRKRLKFLSRAALTRRLDIGDACACGSIFRPLPI